MDANRRRGGRSPRAGSGETWERVAGSDRVRLYRGAPEKESACGDTLAAMAVFAAAVAWLKLTGMTRITAIPGQAGDAITEEGK